MIRTIYKLISINAPLIFNYGHYGSIALMGMLRIDPKYLTEYRCPIDNKLLAKGYLKDSGSMLEAKCRSCGKVSVFTGEDKDILLTRKELLGKGVIPDTE